MWRYPTNDVICKACNVDEVRPQKVRLMMTGNCSRTRLDRKRCELVCPQCEQRTNHSKPWLISEYEVTYGPIPEQLKLPEVA